MALSSTIRTGESNTFNQLETRNANDDSVKQILMSESFVKFTVEVWVALELLSHDDTIPDRFRLFYFPSLGSCSGSGSGSLHI
jgi:hypothetical protein